MFKDIPTVIPVDDPTVTLLPVVATAVTVVEIAVALGKYTGSPTDKL